MSAAKAATEAVIFDMDGLLIDTERVWEAAREGVAREAGGAWRSDAQATLMGMSTPEWTAWMRDELAIPLSAEQIRDAVLERIAAGYRRQVPLLPGAAEAIELAASRWPLAVASSSARTLIELVLERTDLAARFQAIVSSEEVAHGKPAPDVYLEAARRLGAEPGSCVALEDSTAGLRSAAAAGLRVIAVPETDFPPAPEALALADAELGSLRELSVELLAGAG